MASNVSAGPGGFKEQRRTSSFRMFMSTVFFGASERRRRIQWHARVMEAVRELELGTPGVTIEVLTGDPIFNTTIAEADLIAMQSREEEKLQALLYAIQNCTLPGAPAISVQTFFLRFLSELSTTHLKVLALLNNPREWLHSRSIGEDRFKVGTVNSLIRTCLATSWAPGDSSEQILRSLQSRGLLQRHRVDAVMGRDSLLAPRTTAMGRQFLAFIQKPTGL
jgi:hypothetical protein